MDKGKISTLKTINYKKFLREIKGDLNRDVPYICKTRYC